jgi:beta-glucosidase
MPAMARIAFPPGFTWGVATAAFQNEGSPFVDGASPSIWHEFCREPGRIRDGSTADPACDHYRRWREDIALMRELGLLAYRFSTAWNRIIPEPGKVNPAGLGFYDRLVDGLAAAGIEPWLTLFHWDTPAWLERIGGFTVRAAADHFGQFTEAVARRLGDRVKRWITVNEPLVYAGLGYGTGVYAPGRRNDLRGMHHAAHHLLVAHNRAADILRALVPGAKIGIAHHLRGAEPARASRAVDRAAAGFMDAATNRFGLDPLYRGAYPELVVRRARRYLPRTFEDDTAAARGTVDFLGINYYASDLFRWAPLQLYTRAKEWPDPRRPRNPLGWPMVPEGLHRMLARMRTEYGNPEVVVTENGYPAIEDAGKDPLDDPERISYLADHVAVVGRAIAEGSRCTGYFCWTLLDNFEWASGYGTRFGLVRVDFPTQQRQWRASARWFRDLAAANALDPDRTPAGTPA